MLVCRYFSQTNNNLQLSIFHTTHASLTCSNIERSLVFRLDWPTWQGDVQTCAARIYCNKSTSQRYGNIGLVSPYPGNNSLFILLTLVCTHNCTFRAMGSNCYLLLLLALLLFVKAQQQYPLSSIKTVVSAAVWYNIYLSIYIHLCTVYNLQGVDSFKQKLGWVCQIYLFFLLCISSYTSL